MKRASAFVIIALVVIGLIFTMSVYTVDQRKAAIKFQLGEIVATQTQPGLYFLVPIVQNVRLYDMRIQTLDTRDAERYLTKENKNVLVDSFVKWRIIDVRQYFVSVRGDPVAAEARISQTVNDALRAEFARRTVHDVDCRRKHVRMSRHCNSPGLPASSRPSSVGPISRYHSCSDHSARRRSGSKVATRSRMRPHALPLTPQHSGVWPLARARQR